jgi:hypothetical protein
MVIRDLVQPLVYSEYVRGQLELEARVFLENMSTVNSAITFISALLFLAMYLNFATQGGVKAKSNTDKK